MVFWIEKWEVVKERDTATSLVVSKVKAQECCKKTSLSEWKKYKVNGDSLYACLNTI